MSSFVTWPDGRSINGQTITQQAAKIRVGLTDAGDLIVTSDSDDFTFSQVDASGATRVYDILMTERSRATKARVAGKIYATNNLAAPPAATFDLVLQMPGGKLEPAKHPIVRDMTKEVFGKDAFVFQLSKSTQFVNTHTYRPSDASQQLDFASRDAGVVRLQLFAAKFGHTERTFWIQTPQNGRADSIMVVITHTLGQGANFKLYQEKGFTDPFSKPFLEFMRDRFLLWRWGLQVGAAAPTKALLLPIRVGPGPGTLGPFVDHKGIGGQIVNDIAVRSLDRSFSSIDVCTFSNGIDEANVFTANCGLPVAFGVNQDPAHGKPLAHASTKKQYLSGYTTGGPRPGFDYLPERRWLGDPQYAVQKKALGGEYCHTYAIPNYTLAMALSK